MILNSVGRYDKNVNYLRNSNLTTDDIISLVERTIIKKENYKNEKGEKVEETQWHRITAWGKTAEIIEKYVAKGKEIAVEGKLRHRSYDDKNGDKKYVTEIVVSELLLLGK